MKVTDLSADEDLDWVNVKYLELSLSPCSGPFTKAIQRLYIARFSSDFKCAQSNNALPRIKGSSMLSCSVAILTSTVKCLVKSWTCCPGSSSPSSPRGGHVARGHSIESFPSAAVLRNYSFQLREVSTWAAFSGMSTANSVHHGYVLGALLSSSSTKYGLPFWRNERLASRWSLRTCNYQSPNPYFSQKVLRNAGKAKGSQKKRTQGIRVTDRPANISNNNGLSTRCAPSAVLSPRQISCRLIYAAIGETCSAISVASSSARGRTADGSGRVSAKRPARMGEVAG